MHWKQPSSAAAELPTSHRQSAGLSTRFQPSYGDLQVSSDVVEAQTHDLLEYSMSSVTVSPTCDMWAVTEQRCYQPRNGPVQLQHGKQDLDQVLRCASATLELGRVLKGS